MTDYNDDELDDELNEDVQASDDDLAEPKSNGNRNFLIALGVLGALFILVTGVLLFLYFNRGGGDEAGNINATNVAIQTANAQTAIAATLTSAARAAQAQATSTPVPTDTPIPVKPSPTAVLAQPTATTVPETPAAGGLASPTANAQTQTMSAPAMLTQSAQQTQTRQASMNLTATATALPQTGFAEDVGLPGMFGMALGLVLLIVLVRRLRFSSNH